MVDFRGRFLDLQEWYGQTIVGSDQSGHELWEMTVNMTVNGFLEIQKFKCWKTMFLGTGMTDHEISWF